MKIIKNWKLIIFIVLILAITFLIILNIKQNRQIFELEESRTNLLKGERIDYFDLVGTDNRRVDISALNDGKPHLIFIPKQPCLGCNPCLAYWKRIAQILKNEVDVFGIWLGPHQEMFDYQTEAQPGFIFFSPIDMPLFKRKWRLQMNYAQTILYMNNQVEFIKIENLDGEDYSFILRKIREFKKRMLEKENRK